MIALNIWAGPLRACTGQHQKRVLGTLHERPKRQSPPVIYAAMYPGTSCQESPPCDASATVTAGLKCAPEIVPKVDDQCDERRLGTGGGILLSPILLFTGWSHTRESGGVSAAFILLNSASGLAGNLASVESLPAALV